MTKSNGITSLKQAAKLLNRHAPQGESLAYINPEEARVLRARGGSGIMTLAGVPSYEYKWYNPFTWDWSLENIAEKAGDIFGYGDQTVLDKDKKAVQVAGRSPFQDAIAVYAFLRAKKDQGKLNDAEMAEFNRLDAQLTAGKQEFTGYVDEGKQLTAPEYVTTPQAVFSETTGRPDMITTPIATPAEGGRIGAFNGGIQGLMPQQAMPQQGMPQQAMPQQAMLQQGLMPQQGLDPRMGYAAQGGRIGYNLGGIDRPFQGVGALNRMGYALGDEVEQVTETVETPENIQMAGTDTPPIELENLQSLLDAFYEAFGRGPTSMDELKRWALQRTQGAHGGRIGYQGGSGYNWRKRYDYLMDKKVGGTDLTNDEEDELQMIEITILDVDRSGDAQGGRIGAQGGGIMPLLDMGGMEKDYRQEGGFVPIGRKEKADDVPARLSKNEFVFTADAVKAAGGGDIDEGAQRMYNVMKNLEAGGQISQQSQGKA